MLNEFIALLNIVKIFAELKLCTENIRQENEFLRNLHFITIIREPLARYVSHWEHILNIIKTEGTKLKFFGGIMCNQPIDLKGCLPNVNLKNNESKTAIDMGISN